MSVRGVRVLINNNDIQSFADWFLVYLTTLHPRRYLCSSKLEGILRMLDQEIC
jgi:hypothetical protein